MFKTLKNGTAKTSDFAITPSKKDTTVSFEGSHAVSSEDELMELLQTIGAVAEAAGLPNPFDEGNDTPTGERSFDDDEVLAIVAEKDQLAKELDKARIAYQDSVTNQTMMTTKSHENLMRLLEKEYVVKLKDVTDKYIKAIGERDEAIALLP